MYNIKTLRGTIFCSPVKYSKELVIALSDYFEGYLPVIIRDNGGIPGLPVWQLSSPDEKEVLIFNGEKIDLIRLVENVVDNAFIISFSERCKKVFVKLLELINSSCSRMALAPSVIVTEKDVKAPSLYKRLFSIIDFEGVPLDSSNFTQVYRVNKTITDREITINHLSNFQAENELVNMSGINQMRERYIGDFDINTMVNPEYRFSFDDVKSFFDLVPSLFSSFYNLYFSE